MIKRLLSLGVCLWPSRELSETLTTNPGYCAPGGQRAKSGGDVV